MKEIYSKLIAGGGLKEDDAFALFESMMAQEDARISDAQIGAYLYSTAVRPISSAELTGAVRSLRKHMLSVPVAESFPAETAFLDTCGTGGSGFNTFNTSTICALVCAAAGQHVAKHGNRSSTSLCGSADVLEALGVRLDLPIELLLECARETNFFFMFAPSHHPATRNVVRIRKELGFRTIFNFLGPLVNPAGAKYQLMGVSRRELLPIVAAALNALGVKRAMVVCGLDGLDEITLGEATEVYELADGKVRNYQITPEQYAFSRTPQSSVEGSEPVTAAKRVREILSGEKSAYRDLVAFNAGAALYVSEKADSIENGITLAQQVIDSGAALKTLENVISLTNRYDTD